MRLQDVPYLPSDFPGLVRQLTSLYRDTAQQVNLLTEGRIHAVTNAYTAAPTAGEFVQGDFIRNSAPTELGTAASKYVVMGWVCTVSGSPGTFLECRALTGN